MDFPVIWISCRFVTELKNAIQIVLIVSNEYTKFYSRVDLLSFAHIDPLN